MHQLDPSRFPGINHASRHFRTADVFATQVGSARYQLLSSTLPHDHQPRSPLYTFAADLRPALEEVALTSRKRKRGACRTHARVHGAPDGSYCGAHLDPHYVVHADIPSAPQYHIPSATEKLAASIYPLHAKVAKENAEHFQTRGLPHFSKLLDWSQYPLHLYVHCEHVSAVPILYVRRTCAYFSESCNLLMIFNVLSSSRNSDNSSSPINVKIR